MILSKKKGQERHIISDIVTFSTLVIVQTHGFILGG